MEYYSTSIRIVNSFYFGFPTRYIESGLEALTREIGTKGGDEAEGVGA
jgi:hypothetical protein